MKNKSVYGILFLLTILVLTLGLVIAAGNGSSNSSNEDDEFEEEDTEEVEIEIEEEDEDDENEIECVLDSDCKGNKVCIEGECEKFDSEDNEVEIEIEEEDDDDEDENKTEREQNRCKIKIKNGNLTIDPESNCNVTQEGNGTQLYFHLNNGRKSEIKIMPVTASERALEALRLHVCSEENNCTIVLKEVGRGNSTEVAYELEAKKPADVFGFMKTKIKVRAQINAETGEIIRVQKPWWAFIVVEDNEDEEESNETEDNSTELNETELDLNETELNETEINETELNLTD